MERIILNDGTFIYNERTLQEWLEEHMDAVDAERLTSAASDLEHCKCENETLQNSRDYWERVADDYYIKLNEIEVAFEDIEKMTKKKFVQKILEIIG